MKIYKLCFSFLLLAILMAGCSNAKNANENNFKAAAQAFLNLEYPYCYVTVDLPYRTDTLSFSDPSKVLHALSTVGIVKETEVERKTIPASWGSDERIEIIYSYELTDEGAKYYKTDATQSIMGNDLAGLCFGKANVAKVVTFTEPTEFMGVKVSRVTYTYTVSDIPEWAKNAEVQEVIDQLKEDVQSAKTPTERTDAFILTDKGWIHERLMK